MLEITCAVQLIILQNKCLEFQKQCRGEATHLLGLLRDYVLSA